MNVSSIHNIQFPGQSPLQKEMIRRLPKSQALYVEGAFRVWLRDTQVNYFILRGEAVQVPEPTSDEDDLAGIRVWTVGERRAEDIAAALTVHDQEDGSIFGCCATGTSTKDSLLSWVRFLQRENPELEGIPILFSLTTPVAPIVEFDEEGKGTSVTPR